MQEVDANIVAGGADGGKIAENILMFARVLREAGLAASPQKTLLATEAVLATGISDPKILYWTLHAVFVNRRADHDVFHQAFQLFWRDPGYLQQLLSILAPNLRQPPQQRQDAIARRLADSLFAKRESQHAAPRDILQIDARGSMSEAETLQTKDFEQMSADELHLTKNVLREMGLIVKKRRVRRFMRSHNRSQIDVRRILRACVSQGGEAVKPLFKTHMKRRPPLIILCDISGSMDVYARVLLHFLYALGNHGGRVHVFLFGTRLTNITRLLRDRDPDAAMAKIGKQVQDWSGGTRIGDSLASFNRHWLRRVAGQNATILLITDGLDRSDGSSAGVAARRLRASCRRLIWLNPLLRYDAYRPLATGAKELSQHVSQMLPCHNMTSVAGVAAALSGKTSQN